MCYCGPKSSTRVSKYALIMPLLVCIIFKTKRMQEATVHGCCTFSSTITIIREKLQCFNIRQQIAPLKHGRS